MTLTEERTTQATFLIESGMEYDWRAIEQGAMNHAIAPAALKDYAFEAITEAMSVATLVQAYLAEHYLADVEKEEETEEETAAVEE
jgi:hypothetical protein